MGKRKSGEPISNKESLLDWQHSMMLKQLGVIAGRLDGQRKEQKCRMLVLALLQAATVVLLMVLIFMMER